MTARLGVARRGEARKQWGLGRPARLSAVRDSAGLRPKRRVGVCRREAGSRNRERKNDRIGMTDGLKDISRVFPHYVIRCFRVAVLLMERVNVSQSLLKLSD